VHLLPLAGAEHAPCHDAGLGATKLGTIRLREVCLRGTIPPDQQPRRSRSTGERMARQ
jgi:hypothetical protein